MNKDEIMFQQRLRDLAKAAYMRNIPMFTDFLSMNELSILHALETEWSDIHIDTYGGYELAERQMARITPDALFSYTNIAQDFPYPLSILKIEPANRKFAESLSHRDYLGSLIGLGIERCKIGDIIVDESAAYVYCHQQIQDYFITELTKVRHTSVKTSLCIDDIRPTIQLSEQKGTVSSLRADAVIAMVYHMSRSSCNDLFRSQRIFINGRLTESNSQLLKEGDTVSVRGFGKFIFNEILSVTKKERLYVKIQTYGRR